MGNALAVAHCEEAAVEVPVEVDEVEAVEVEAEEEVVEEPKREIVIQTAPIDYRFPTTNQARNCFVKYNEAHKCFAEHGGPEAAECARRARDYRSICPTEWLDKWNEAREAGHWYGRY